MFGRLDDPDQTHAARGHGTVRKPGDEVSHEWDLVRYTDTTGEEQDRPVRVKHLITAIGAFNKSTESDTTIRGFFGFFEKSVCEAGTAANN